jgi:hypothetical protein
MWSHQTIRFLIQTLTVSRKNILFFLHCEMKIKTILNFPAKSRKTIFTDIALPIPIITVYNNYCYKQQSDDSKISNDINKASFKIF